MKEDEIKNILRKVLAESGMIDNIEHIKKTCDQTNTKVENIVVEVETLKLENAEIKHEMSRIKEENAELRTKLYELDQYGRKNDIIIRNIPMLENENSKKVISNAIQALGVTLSEFDITVAHRLPANKGVKPIIARFHSYEKKKEVMKAAKIAKPSGEDIGINTKMPIYFDDHLSKETKQRWLEAREMVDAGMIHSARCIDGKIKVKELQDGPTVIYGNYDSIKYKEWKNKTNSATPCNKRNNDARSPVEELTESTDKENGSVEIQQRLKISRTNKHTTMNKPKSDEKRTSSNENGRRSTQSTLDFFKMSKA